MGHRVAVAGATGNLGREVIRTLSERAFPADRVVALASGRAVGSQVSYGEDAVLTAASQEKHDWSGTDLLFVAPGATAPAALATRAARAGVLVVDLTGASGAPPIVPEVNPEALSRAMESGRILSSPGPAATLLTLVAKPLHDLFGATRAVVTGHIPTSEAGKEAMDELFSQTRAFYVNDPFPPEHLPKPIAFNLYPGVGGPEDDGSTDEELRLVEEVAGLLGLPVTATLVRVPVFIGATLAVHLTFEREVDEDAAREALRDAPGLAVLDRREEGGYVSAAESAGEDLVYVSRLRRDPTVSNGLALWIAGDNLRKGGALNAVQVAEEAHQHDLIGV
ncbi:aspartate-semialdehyde dehydrogenase [Roseomonas sp. CCTCC AB2023176]|uniref:aspartate-semialdehyde dehydrogenase n=1 Tax=Roseomonas sp. CCTCC AB2023176 TaxID=3342640 RepID=UPI0035DCAD96